MGSPVTPSESYLSQLCRRAFLYLWSYPNLYRDQGHRGEGHGKELCDLLVVFGNDLFRLPCRFRGLSVLTEEA